MIRAAILPMVETFVSILAPACDRIQIAGSIRREKPDVKDVEIVAIPKSSTHTNLLGEPISGAPTLLDELLEQLTRKLSNTYQFDQEVKRNGPRYKRLVTRFEETVSAVDLFLADSDNWGNQLAIRTGSREFGKWFMTKQSYGGAMPFGMRQIDGYLWRNGQKVRCPEEEDYFRALGIPCLPPPERTEAGIRKIKALAVRRSREESE